ncbi:MAG: hypothetical protein AAB886_01890 [Patescibacteria group bacterium]
MSSHDAIPHMRGHLLEEMKRWGEGYHFVEDDDSDEESGNETSVGPIDIVDRALPATIAERLGKDGVGQLRAVFGHRALPRVSDDTVGCPPPARALSTSGRWQPVAGPEPELVEELTIPPRRGSWGCSN